MVSVPFNKFATNSPILNAIMRQKGRVVRISALGGISDLAGICRPLIYMALIDRLMKSVSISSIAMMCALLAGVSLLEAVFSWAREHYSAKLSGELALDYQFDAWGRLVARQMDQASSIRGADAVDRLGTVGAVATARVNGVLGVIMHAPVALIMICCLATLNWILALFYVTILPIMLLVSGFVRRSRDSLVREYQEAGGRYRSDGAEIYAGQETILSLSAQKFAFQRVWRHVSDVVSSGFHSDRYSSIQVNASNFTQNVSTIALLFVAAILVLSGILTLGQLVAFEMISTQLKAKLRTLSSLYEGAKRVELAEGRLPQWQSMAAPVVEKVKVDGEGGAFPLRTFIPSFKYYEQQDPLISNIDFIIKRADIIRISGESGVGKSTLARLISGLIEAPGAITPRHQLDSSGGSVLYIPQEPFLVHGSVYENIAMIDHREISEEERRAVERSARAAGINIADLPRVISEGGKNISGGQRQRLHLARAFLRRCDLLILDEPTRGLDRETAEVMLRSICESADFGAVLIISHDPLVARYCNREISIKSDSRGLQWSI